MKESLKGERNSGKLTVLFPHSTINSTDLMYWLQVLTRQGDILAFTQ